LYWFQGAPLEKSKDVRFLVTDVFPLSCINADYDPEDTQPAFGSDPPRRLEADRVF